MRCVQWIYQDRPTESPWALLLSVEKNRLKYTACASFYADWLNTPDKRFELGEFDCGTPRALIEKVGAVCNAYRKPLDRADITQLCAELHDMRAALSTKETYHE